LIPLMKLRFAGPTHLVDLNFIKETSYIKEEGGFIRIGALTRHAEIENSMAASRVPILHDCAAGIADVQVRNRGTIGGSVAEADPSGDWATVLMTLPTKIHCSSRRDEREVKLRDFVKDAYTTALNPDELVREVSIQTPAKGSGGAYIAFKRAAPVYPTASVAVQLLLEGEICKEVAIALGCVGLTPVRPSEAEDTLRGERISEKTIAAAATAARKAADPQSDMRGSVEYKRELVGALVKRAIEAALRRTQGQRVEMNHLYA
jgi:aerobic carbon-monoxide dehydrogenase medium subunit